MNSRDRFRPPNRQRQAADDARNKRYFGLMNKLIARVNAFQHHALPETGEELLSEMTEMQLTIHIANVIFLDYSDLVTVHDREYIAAARRRNTEITCRVIHFQKPTEEKTSWLSSLWNKIKK